MDDALQRTLDRIERRQRYVLVLLCYPYLAGGVWLATRNTPLALGAPVLLIGVTAYLLTLVRARTGASDGGTETDVTGE